MANWTGRRRTGILVPLVGVALAAAFVLLGCASQAPAPTAAPAPATKAPAAAATQAPAAPTQAPAAAAATQAPAKPKEIIAFDLPIGNYNGSVRLLPIALAAKKGFFEQEGLRANIVQTGGGAETVQAVTLGGAPIAVSTPETALGAIEGGQPVKIVALPYHGSTLYFVVKADSPIKTIKDLRGRKVAYTRPGSLSHFSAKLMIAQAGFTEQDTQLVSAGSMGAAVALFEQGQVDSSTHPGLIVGERNILEGKWRNLWQLSEARPYQPEMAVIASNDTIQNRPQIIQSYFRAIQKAIDYIAEGKHADELAAVTVEFMKLKPDDLPAARKIAEEMARQTDQLWKLKVDLKELQSVAADAVELKQIKEVPKDWSKVFDDRFLR